MFKKNVGSNDSSASMSAKRQKRDTLHTICTLHIAGTIRSQKRSFNKFNVQKKKRKTTKLKSLYKFDPTSFLIAQLVRADSSNPNAHWSSSEKETALSVFMNSPKEYKYFKQFFFVPSARTLHRNIFKFPFSTGLDSHVVKLLSVVSETLTKLDRYCTIMFDEIRVTPALYLQREKIVGFSDLGSGERSAAIADRLLLFLIRGINADWKIPIAVYLSEKSIRSVVLKRLIHEIVIVLLNVGFTPLCSISDQGVSNVAAVTSLSQDTQDSGEPPEELYYIISGQKLYHIYDPPHLLKCLRNHFLKKDIMTANGLASWSHIKTAYEKDLDRWFTSKITDRHISPNNFDKIKVSLAAEVFSRSMTRALIVTAETNIPETDATIRFLFQIDDLFDSMNGTSRKHDESKPLKGLLDRTSGHIHLWLKMENIMSSWRFVCSETNRELSQPAFVKNWMLTLRSMRCLWSELQNLGFKSLATGRLNKDPIENFFRSIRALRTQNVRPSAYQALLDVKTLLVYSLSSSTTIYQNCQSDKIRLLKSLEDMMNLSEALTATNHSVTDALAAAVQWYPSYGCLTEAEDLHVNDIGMQLCRQFFKEHGCNRCKGLLLTTAAETHQLRSDFISAIQQAVSVIEQILERNAVSDRLLCLAHVCLDKFCQWDWFLCFEHSEHFWISFKLVICRETIRTWCADKRKELRDLQHSFVKTFSLSSYFK